MNENTYPLVTIGIPTYNRADSYLSGAIQCAIDQTYPNIEIIISDNASTDETEAVVASFSAPNLKYIKHPENIGANNNFNFCLEQAQGDYFLLFHDDDLIDPDFVETCMQAVDYRTDVGLIRTGTRSIDATGNVRSEKRNRVVGFSTSDFFLGWFTGKTSLYLCSTLFNTQKLKEIGGFNSKHQLFQDDIAEVQLAAKYGRVDVEDVKASFRQHENTRTVTNKVQAWCEDSLILLDLMCDLAPDKKDLVRRIGTRYFTRVNYNFARAIESPRERLRTYWMVYKLFDYRYPPFYFYFYDLIKKGLWWVRRQMLKVKKILVGGK